MLTRAEVESWFALRTARLDQLERIKAIREAGKALALAIFERTPGCADQSAALRQVREAVMTAEEAIVLHD